MDLWLILMQTIQHYWINLWYNFNIPENFQLQIQNDQLKIGFVPLAQAIIALIQNIHIIKIEQLVKIIQQQPFAKKSFMLFVPQNGGHQIQLAKLLTHFLEMKQDLLVVICSAYLSTYTVVSLGEC